MSVRRSGFTLIELMIVIAIIAIIAAIAIPNLIESRITANESAASASLKSGVHPAQVQFQGGGYSDSPAGVYSIFNGPAGVGGNGIADFAGVLQQLSGGCSVNGSPVAVASGPCISLLPPTWANGVQVPGGGFYANPANGGTWGGPLIGGYIFGNVASNELGFCVTANPDHWGSDGRRRFAINVSGTVISVIHDVEITPEDATHPPFGAAPFRAIPTGSIWKVHK